MRAHTIALWLLTPAVILCGLSFAVHVAGEQRRGSTSMGNPNDGRLVNGAELVGRGPGYYSNPNTTNKNAKWGTDEMVGALKKIGTDMERWAPGATLIINDIGLPEGGTIPHHQSHQAGRDVDLNFYQLSTKGEIVRARAVRFDAEGKGVFGAGNNNPSDDREVRFDTQRNWNVLRSLIENPEAHLQRVFVAERLRSLMMDWAEQEGEPAWIIERAGEVMCEPAVPHDNHFHVRLFCTVEDYRQGCRDSWPIYPWRRTEYAPLGISEVETAVPRPRKRSWRRRYKRAVFPGRTWCP